MRNIFILAVCCLLGLGAWAQDVPTKAVKLLDKAKKEQDSGNLAGAVELLDKALAVHPSYFKALQRKANIQIKLEDYAGAESTFVKIAEVFPERSARVYHQLGKLYMEQEQYGQAIQHFKTAAQQENVSEKLLKNIKAKKKLSVFRKKLMDKPVSFKPENLGDKINTEKDEYLPMLTADDGRLLFTRRFVNNGGFLDEDFYWSTQGENGWEKAKNLGSEINTMGMEGALSVSPDGQVLFFAAMGRNGGYGNFDIYYSYLRHDIWKKPLNIGGNINRVGWESQPSISADGKELYFASKRKDNIGGIDIWVSYLEDDERWGLPINLGQVINTGGDEQSPFIHPDGKTLYFTSNGHMGMGGTDIFMSVRDENGNWSDPVNLGYPINTAKNEGSLFVDTNGDTGYFAAENGDMGMDIYSFEMPTEIRPKFTTYVQAKVTDAKTKAPLSAVVEIIDLETGELVNKVISDNTNGGFLCTLPSGKSYACNVSKSGYTFYSANFDLKKHPNRKPYELSIALQPVKVAEKLVMNNIFFEVNSFELKKESEPELNKLFDFMQENPDVSIEIVGHTDSDGDEQTNLELSINRAKSVEEYLKGKGVASSRLTSSGKGESEPIASNDTAEGRAQNRRTEVIIRR